MEKTEKEVNDIKPTPKPPYLASALVAIIILIILLGLGIYLMLNGDALADEAVLSTTSPSPNIVATDLPTQSN